MVRLCGQELSKKVAVGSMNLYAMKSRLCSQLAAFHELLDYQVDIRLIHFAWRTKDESRRKFGQQTLSYV